MHIYRMTTMHNTTLAILKVTHLLPCTLCAKLFMWIFLDIPAPFVTFLPQPFCVFDSLEPPCCHIKLVHFVIYLPHQFVHLGHSL